MNTSIHHRVKMLIEETNDAFSTCDTGGNADYAEFATLALSDFKNALRKPGLTHRELANLLRTGMARHRVIDPDSCWATFMAYYISKTSNTTRTPSSAPQKQFEFTNDDLQEGETMRA